MEIGHIAMMRILKLKLIATTNRTYFKHNKAYLATTTIKR